MVKTVPIGAERPTRKGEPSASSGRTSLPVRLAYGFGSGAIGVKDNGLSYFLLLFYSQVVGLDARLVGLALTAALVLDACLDPIVGYWSDEARTRIGRRHPFMYAAALPFAGLYGLLWTPPVGWPPGALFAYLLIVTILVRIGVSIYQIPSNALAAELTDDYDERSALLSFRSFFGWAVGNAMTVLMFSAVFPAMATPANPTGQFNRAAYRIYGEIAAGLIFLSVLVSSVGTHGEITKLKAPPPARRLSLQMIFAEIFETLSNQAFLALFAATALGYVAAGFSAALAFYWLAYFWEFPPNLTGLITMGVFVSAILGAGLAPPVSRRFGKKRAAIVVGLIAFLGSPTPILLRLLGLLPPNGSPLVFWLVLATTVFDTALIITFEVLSSSMVADLVELAEVRTGRRSEGVFAASITFTQKVVNGFGIVLAGIVLTAAGVGTGAHAGRVAPDALWRLGAWYVPIILGLWMSMLTAIGAYDIDRSRHQENLRTLAGRRAQDGGPERLWTIEDWGP